MPVHPDLERQAKSETSGEFPRVRVLAALDRMIASRAFGKAERPARFLRHLVEATLRGESHLLKENVLGVDVFDRPASWDPRLDPVVRQEAGRLRKRLARYYDQVGPDAEIVIDLPVGAYVPTFRRISAGTEPLHPEPAPEKNPARPPRAWRYAAAGILCIAAALIAWRSFAPHRPVISNRAVNPAAQDLYLKGKYYWNKRTPESLNQAVDLFTQAIVRDPGYAKPYAGLADCYNLLREYSAMPPSEAWPRAIAAAQKAVELDNSSAEAHSSLAFALFYGALDTRNGEREFRRAIQLDPNYAKAHHWYATSLMMLGRYRESLAEIEKARQLDPSSTSVLADKGFILYHADQTEEAIKLLKQVEAAEPAFQSAHAYLAAIYLGQGDSANYLLESHRQAELSQSAPAMAIWAAAQKGFVSGGTRGMLMGILKIQQEHLEAGHSTHFDVAETCALLGKRQEALDQLEAAIENREMNILAMGNAPTLASLRGDPRFQELQKRSTLAR
jgi:tetratricopeptide (TPR) repeat protein